MEEIALRIKAVIDDFLDNDLKPVNWDYKPLPEKWSKKEIIGHLTDSAQINLQRFVRCTFEEEFKLIYHQAEWVQAQRYQHAGIEQLLGLWRLLNLQIIRVLENYPAERKRVLCDTGKTEISLHTIEWVANDYVEHLIHHLNQII